MTNENKKSITVYVLYEDWSINYERGSKISLYRAFEEAKCNFEKRIQEELENGMISEIKKVEQNIEECSETYYDCCEDGYSAAYHYTIRILEKEL